MLSDEELLRYSRQILMPRFDIAGQENSKPPMYWSSAPAAWVAP